MLKLVLGVLALAAATSPVRAAPPPPIEARLQQLGFAGVPPAPSARARQALVKAGKRARPEDAIAELRAALADSPAFAEARFELARRLAMLGDHPGARAELDRLLAEDLHAFASRFQDDAAFATLRTSADGKVLTARIAELATLWDAAIARGAPMNLFAGTHGEQEILTARVLRAGVYVHAVKRFFAIAPPLPKTHGAFVDLEHDRAIVITAEIDDCRADFCPKIPRITLMVWPLALASKPSASHTYRSAETRSAVIESVAGGLRFRVTDCMQQSCRSPWFTLTTTGAKRDPVQKPTPNAITLELDWRGVQLDLPSAGIEIAGKTAMVAGRKLPLDSWRHASATLRCNGYEGNDVYIVSTVARCQCGTTRYNGYVLLHAIARLDLTTGTSTPVAEGPGIAGAVRGRDGAVYLQRDHAVTRHASIGTLTASTGEPLPAGLVIEPPIPLAMYCCGL